MASVYLMASRPGAFTKEGLILGNPEVKKDNFVPSAVSWGVAADLVMAVGAEKRVLSVVTDVEIEVLQLSAGETTASFQGVPTTIPTPTSGKTSYACFLHPATVGVYVRTP